MDHSVERQLVIEEIPGGDAITETTITAMSEEKIIQERSSQKQQLGEEMKEMAAGVGAEPGK